MKDTTPNYETYARRLLHRWLVEYNPLYLLSAMLVLGGMILTSRGLARDASLYGSIGVAAIAELYALTLIGGAALLTRIGQRRPGVMLALLTVLYQWDLTLHVETCVNLGLSGAIATGAWLAMFAAKVHGLAWAMKIRISRPAFAAATLAALGLAVLPHVLNRTDARYGTALVALWLTALTSLHRTGAVTSLVELDNWGATVRRRVERATWLLSGLLLVLHVTFWSTQYPVKLAALASIAPLLATRWIRGEARVWCIAVATLVVTALRLPGTFSLVAFIAAIALALRARDAARAPTDVRVTVTERGVSGPYRASAENAQTTCVEQHVVTDGAAAMVRLFTGSAVALYLWAWTFRWSSGPWPSHVIALDLVFSIAVVFVVWKRRVRGPIAPMLASWLHFVVQARLIPAPHTTLEWGGASVALGFALLIASLAGSYWLRSDTRQDASGSR